MGTKRDQQSKRCDGFIMALLDPHRYLYKEISYILRLTLIKRVPTRKRVPQDTCINEDPPYKEKSSLPRNKCQLYATIKTLKPSQTKVCIIYLSSGILESRFRLVQSVSTCKIGIE